MDPDGAQIVILVTEDREADWEEIQYVLLDDLGINAKLLWAPTDEDAMAFIKSHQVTAVLMDINLQGSSVDGIELCRRITASNAAGDTQVDVVMCTTSTAKDDIERSIAAGAIGYLEKLEGEYFTTALAAFTEACVNRKLLTSAEAALFAYISPSLQQ